MKEERYYQKQLKRYHQNLQGILLELKPEIKLF